MNKENKKLHREWYKAIYQGYCQDCDNRISGRPCIENHQAGVIFSAPVDASLDQCPMKKEIVADMRIEEK